MLPRIRILCKKTYSGQADLLKFGLSGNILPMVYTPFVLESSWQKVMEEELCLPYMAQLAAFLEQERAGAIPIFPPADLVFNAFIKAPFEAVNVVIVGQDPYHGAGQAHGLCFSVPAGVPPPPSLLNIFKEIAADIGCPLPKHGCLTSWAKQGVLLLNATLTVREGQPMSHFGKGWERFTDAVIERLNEREDPVIFVLWGNSAKKKGAKIQPRHPVLTAAHPSPLSAHNGFFGCRHFSKINELLVKQKKEPINWSN
jgi:uracil-DNA glycosylase